MDGCWGKTLTSYPPLCSVLYFSVLSTTSSSPSSPCAPLSLPSCLPPSLIDCNNKNKDNNGGGGLSGDVKKHNIIITNTIRSQWPATDLSTDSVCAFEGRARLLACCIYGHFLPSLNRAGCAGSLLSLLQMVCIMFEPPCHCAPSLSPFLSLPLFLSP